MIVILAALLLVTGCMGGGFITKREATERFEEAAQRSAVNRAKIETNTAQIRQIETTNAGALATTKADLEDARAKISALTERIEKWIGRQEAKEDYEAERRLDEQRRRRGAER